MTDDLNSPQFALLVLDMQDRFLSVIHNAERVIRRTQFAIEAARTLSLPILFTEQIPEKLGPTRPELIEAASSDSPVFAKTAFSALGSTEVLKYLETNAIGGLVIAGIETPICVFQTAREAIRRQIGCVVLSDATGARKPEDAAAAIDNLRHEMVDIIPSESFFYEFLGDATAPCFRDFTNLVKAYN